MHSGVARSGPVRACAQPSLAQQESCDSRMNLTRTQMHYLSCNTSIFYVNLDFKYVLAYLMIGVVIAKGILLMRSLLSVHCRRCLYNKVEQAVGGHPKNLECPLVHALGVGDNHQCNIHLAREGQEEENFCNMWPHDSCRKRLCKICLSHYIT